MQVHLTLTGTTPLLCHNPQLSDPQFEITRQIKALTGKRKKTDEDLRKIEELEWFGGLYIDNGALVQPTSKVRKCLIEAARLTKLGKAVERALPSFTTINVPLIYERNGHPSIEALYEDPAFRSRLSVGVSGKRVMRVRPQFLPWRLEAEALFVEDAGLNFDELARIAEMAGIAIGIGDNRVNGYGRFTVEVRGA